MAREAAKKRRKSAASAPPAKRPRLVAGCPAVAPTAAGLSAAPLAALRRTVREEVHELGSLSGVAHIVLRDGKCVLAHSDGWANIETGTKFGLRTLCALHSCSKPLTVAAFLTLVDEGKVRLSDSIDKYVPFSQFVATGVGKPARKVKKRPTLHHLLAQVAGLRHSDENAYGPLVERLKRHEICDLAGFCEGLAKVPLQSEPGSLHYYSLAIDVLGRVCEVVSGKTLDKFVTESLLHPLGMFDTHFVVPAAKLRRTALLYDCRRVSAAKRRAGDKPYCAHPWSGPKMDPGVFSGGGGILSYSDAGMYGTAEDYARFCQMLLNGGLAPGGRRRVLRARTVRRLWEDCLTPFAKSDGRAPGWNDFGGDDPKEKFYWDHHAWSLLNATLDLERAPKGAAAPRRGHTLWMYGMGAYWLVDTRRKLVAVSFAQNFSSRAKDRGADCVPFAKAAVDEGPAGAKLNFNKSEKFYGKDP